MHDIHTQEVGKFLDGALDEHSKAGVEVGDIGFQSIDVLTDDLNLLHEKGLCEVDEPTGVPKSRKPEVSSVEVAVAEVAFLVTE